MFFFFKMQGAASTDRGSVGNMTFPLPACTWRGRTGSAKNRKTNCGVGVLSLENYLGPQAPGTFGWVVATDVFVINICVHEMSQDRGILYRGVLGMPWSKGT